MALAPDLLAILVCPVCKADLTARYGENGKDETGLKCTACHRLYPVRDGIPVMLEDEATIEAADA